MLELLKKDKVNKKHMRKFDVRSHVKCRRQLSDLTYPPCGFNEYYSDTNDDNSNISYNDNINNNSNGNTDNKNKHINNGNVHFCNS